MSNKKQTAVEFLVKEFNSILGPIKTTPMQDLLLVDAINKAKELQKQQTIDAYCDGRMHVIERKICPSEEYYNETYGGDNG